MGICFRKCTGFRVSDRSPARFVVERPHEDPAHSRPLSSVTDRPARPHGLFEGGFTPPLNRRQSARYRNGDRQGTIATRQDFLTALPPPDASPAAAITTDTIYFMDDRDAACAEPAPGTLPRGRAVILVADPNTLAPNTLAPNTLAPNTMAETPFTAHRFRPPTGHRSRCDIGAGRAHGETPHGPPPTDTRSPAHHPVEDYMSAPPSIRISVPVI